MSKLSSEEWDKKITQMKSDLSQARKEKAKAKRRENDEFTKEIGKLMRSLFPEYTTISDFEKAFARVPSHVSLMGEKSRLQDPSESDRKVGRSDSE